MSDLDRYLTEGVVEKATYAVDTSGDLRDEVHGALSAVLPDIIRRAKVEALQEAATACQWGGWAHLPQADCDIPSKRRQAEHAVAWLRKRADRIESRDV